MEQSTVNNADLTAAKDSANRSNDLPAQPPHDCTASCSGEPIMFGGVQ